MAAAGGSPEGTLSNKEKYEQKKQREKELRKLKSQVAKYEQEIAMMETAIFHLNQKMLQPDFYNDAAASQKTLDEQAQLKKKLEGLVSEWETVAGDLEKMEKQNI